MPDNYDDIKHLTRPQFDDLPPMSMHDRAGFTFCGTSVERIYESYVQELVFMDK